ncbi:hypothetical protein PGTUg99_022279, partial [Puccinia graminis f. sp. tritici]
MATKHTPVCWFRHRPAADFSWTVDLNVSPWESGVHTCIGAGHPEPIGSLIRPTKPAVVIPNEDVDVDIQHFLAESRAASSHLRAFDY